MHFVGFTCRVLLLSYTFLLFTLQKKKRIKSNSFIPKVSYRLTILILIFDNNRLFLNNTLNSVLHISSPNLDLELNLGTRAWNAFVGVNFLPHDHE